MSKNLLHEVFAFANTRPEHPAIVGTRLNLNYKTFTATVQRFAAKLRSQGIRPGNVVGIKLRPELQAVAVAAVMHEGAVSFAATKSIVEAYDQDIDFVITEDAGWLSSKTKAVLVDTEWLASLGAINHQIEILDFDSDDALALLVFSSGTTGIPKGVEFSLDSIRTRTDAAAKNWMPFHPFFAELGLDTVSGIQTYFWSLLHGETYFLSGSSKDNVQLIQENGIRSIKTSPSKLIDLVSSAYTDNLRLDGLREVQVAGGLLSPNTANGLGAISNAELKYLYGSTEAGTVTKGNYDPADPESVGKVVPESEVLIKDEQGQILEPGKNGYLHLKTPYQAKKYWLTEESHNTGFHDGWFIPGDTAVLSETGKLRVTGRIDELINAAGVKLNPSLIDSKLADYRGIQDLASFGYEEPGLLHKKLGLAIVVNSSISMERLRIRVRDLFPDINYVAIMEVSEIPRNTLGKPLRGELAEMYRLELQKNGK